MQYSNADQVDICKSKLMIFACAECHCDKRVRQSAETLGYCVVLIRNDE